MNGRGHSKHAKHATTVLTWNVQHKPSWKRIYSAQAQARVLTRVTCHVKCHVHLRDVLRIMYMYMSMYTNVHGHVHVNAGPQRVRSASGRLERERGRRRPSATVEFRGLYMEP